MLRIDRDSASTPKQWQALLAAIHAGEADLPIHHPNQPIERDDRFLQLVRSQHDLPCPQLLVGEAQRRERGVDGGAMPSPGQKAAIAGRAVCLLPCSNE